MEISFSINELNAVVQRVWQENKQYKVWLFFAGMGCGKTTFINTLCKFLEVEDVSNSPTFSIINEYKSNQVGTIYHLDLYRLKDAEDAIDAGVEDVLYSKNYCFVEWPEQALELMPDDALKIIIELMNDGKRKLIY